MRTRPDALALATLAAVFAIGWMLVAPWSDVPVIDDWAYAWSVEHLLKAGRIAINDQVVANCTQAHGAGSFVLKIPTTGGTKTVTGRFTVVATAGTTVSSGDIAGTATVISAVGDCVTTPLTSATAVLTAHVT